MLNTHAQPWYYELWPWLLMAGPFAVVIASGITFWLAYAHMDPLVVDDYYKAGKTINMTLRRDTNARSLGLSGNFVRDREHISIALSSNTGVLLPQTLNLLVTHATQREKDRAVRLSAIRPGVYDGVLGNIESGHYLLTLEDSRETWRLTGDWHAGADRSVIVLQAKQ